MTNEDLPPIPWRSYFVGVTYGVKYEPFWELTLVAVGSDSLEKLVGFILMLNFYSWLAELMLF